MARPPKTDEHFSQRLNLLVKPSTIAQAKKIAWTQRTSVNAIVNKLLEEFVATHSDDILKYDNFNNTEGDNDEQRIG